MSGRGLTRERVRRPWGRAPRHGPGKSRCPGSHEREGEKEGSAPGDDGENDGENDPAARPLERPGDARDPPLNAHGAAPGTRVGSAHNNTQPLDCGAASSVFVGSSTSADPSGETNVLLWEGEPSDSKSRLQDLLRDATTGAGTPSAPRRLPVPSERHSPVELRRARPSALRPGDRDACSRSARRAAPVRRGARRQRSGSACQMGSVSRVRIPGRQGSTARGAGR